MIRNNAREIPRGSRNDTRVEIKQDIAEVRADISAMEVKLGAVDAKLSAVETRIIKGFIATAVAIATLSFSIARFMS